MDKSVSGLAKEEAALELPTAALAAPAQLWNSLACLERFGLSLWK